MNEELSVRHELRAGDIGRIVTLHGEIYDELPGFGLTFEAFVGHTLAEFVLQNSANGKLWLLERNGELMGCAAVALRSDNRGQIRWVVVDPSLRGKGLGKRLVNEAIQYCRDENCHTIFLETTDGLPESQGLYESLGFAVTSETDAELWNGIRPLIIMELILA